MIHRHFSVPLWKLFVEENENRSISKSILDILHRKLAHQICGGSFCLNFMHEVIKNTFKDPFVFIRKWIDVVSLNNKYQQSSKKARNKKRREECVVKRNRSMSCFLNLHFAPFDSQVNIPPQQQTIFVESALRTVFSDFYMEMLKL